MPGESDWELNFRARVVGYREIKQSWSDILDWLHEKATEVWAATGKEAKQAMNDGFKAVGDTYDELEKSFKTTTTSAIKGSIVPLIKGTMDKVEDIWDTAWGSMEVAAGAKNRLIRVSAGLLFMTVMVINNKPHPACDPGDEVALSPIKTRSADDYLQPVVFCAAA